MFINDALCLANLHMYKKYQNKFTESFKKIYSGFVHLISENELNRQQNIFLGIGEIKIEF